MHAAVIQCDLRMLAAPREREYAGRVLAARLGTLPGFVAFVALDAEAEAGMVTALCICESAASAGEAQRLILQWHADACGDAGIALREIGSGAVIAQRGL